MFNDSTPKRSQDCLSDLVLDQWFSGELDEGRVRDCMTHTASCAACASRWSEIQREARRFLERFPLSPPERQARKLSSNEEVPTNPPAVERGSIPQPGWPARPEPLRALWPVKANPSLLGAAAALAATVALWMHTSTQPSPSGISGNPVGSAAATSEFGERSKGDHHISFFVKRDGRIFAGQNGMVTYPSDKIRFAASVSRAQHLAILSLDAAGVVSVYHAGAESVEPSPLSAAWPLPSSVALDNTLGSERIFAVFCEDEIPTPQLEQELGSLGMIKPRVGCSTDELSWLKERR